MSPMNAVKSPMPDIDTIKHDQPPCRSVEGVSGCAGHVATPDYRLYANTYRQLIMGENLVSRKQEAGEAVLPAEGWDGGKGRGGVLEAWHCVHSDALGWRRRCRALPLPHLVHSWRRREHEAALEGRCVQH